MCGRFYLNTNKGKLAKQFGVADFVETKTSYNITPSSDCTVVRLNNNSKEFASLNWGLVPSWTKPDITIKPINAKAETIREKPYFRTAFKQQRCIIPVSGFYEWQGSKGNKQAYAIYPLNDSFFGFAGLWEKKDELESFTIITTEANELMKTIHHRMPVILDSGDYDVWLEEGVYQLLKPYPSNEMGCYMISSAVNKPSNNSADLIKPV
jgi:putative SOS response-associated peptidase YedK